MMKKSSGFTLVEVLIASVIMMTVLALAANLFLQNRLSSKKAQQVILLHSPLPLIVDTIRHQIRTMPEQELHGDGAFEQVQYRWSARTESFMAPPASLVIESNQWTPYAPRYRLYQVELELSYQGTSRVYHYKELAWLSKAQAE